MSRPGHPILSWAVVITVVVAALLLTGYVRQPTILNLIKQKGELVVVTHIGPTTYYEGADGPTGFEYDLAREFADYLGVKLKIVVADNLNTVIPTLLNEKADLAAAGLTVTAERSNSVRFGPSYEKVTQQLIYRQNHLQPPASIKDVNGYIEVVAGSSHAETLKSLARQNPNLEWEENYQADVDNLLELVWQKELDYTIADSNQIAISRRYYPELAIAFDVSDPVDLAWALPRNDDFSLYREVRKFFDTIKRSGDLALLKDRYFGHIGDFDYVDTRTFIKHIDRRLSHYQDHFIKAASRYDEDWRLLAAIGYQESHWDPQAMSPTGVRGIMMLTRRTAADLGIKNRINPRNSIVGGARYLSQLKKRLPGEISEPDRTWFALAAYNVGLGHVNDARLITRRLGGNPNKWMHVSKNLPLLMQKRWYKQTRHGYARGIEAVHYVENIRNYFDILVWHDTNPNKTPTSILVKYNPDSKASSDTNPVL